ncbi:MAG: hypothetical protein AB1746_03785 [Candidatus Zixiibacteriota bacterium]
MVIPTKSKSPFYPGQPVPVELFVGRQDQISRIMERGAGQVKHGKPVAIFTQGEYGIGKSSLATFVQFLAEKDYGLHGIYAPLGGCQNINDIASAVLEATIRSGAFNPKRSEKIRNWLGKYIGDQNIFGFSLNLASLKRDAPQLSTAHGMLSFFGETMKRLEDDGVNGIFLILDEINGITSDPLFGNFIKSLVDSNAMSKKPVPLLLMLCGVEDRRREMIQKHPPVDRIFDVVDISSMSKHEMEEFFTRAFASVQIRVEASALDILTFNAAGFPKIMHLIGDAAYWRDKDQIIDDDDAMNAVLIAAEDVGKKYVDQQVYKALRSEAYRKILKKIARLDISPSISFTKEKVVGGLSDSEKRKFNNFLRKMKQLKVLKAGDARGEYVFTMRMVYLYIWMQSGDLITQPTEKRQ